MTFLSLQMRKWNRTGISNVAGEVALLCGTVMWIASISHVRRKLFELFFYTHHLYIVFLVFFVLHVGFVYSCIMLPGLYLFLVDRFLRFLQSQQKNHVISARVLPCRAMELNFAKDPSKSYICIDCSILDHYIDAPKLIFFFFKYLCGLRAKLYSIKRYVHQCEEHIKTTMASVHYNLKQEY